MAARFGQLENRGGKLGRVRQAGSYPDAASEAGSRRSAVFVLLITLFGALAAGTLLLAAPLAPLGAFWSPPAHRALSATVIALTNNVDNLGARLAYSIQGTKVGVAINAWISAITFVISAGAAWLGGIAVMSLGRVVSSLVAMAMLVSLGLWMILHARLQSWHARIHEEKTATQHIQILTSPHHADIDDSKHIDFVEGTLLGVALSINNIAGGVASGVLGLDPMLVGFLSAAISFIAIFAGNHVAEFFIERRISDKAAFVGGVALILIGLKQLF